MYHPNEITDLPIETGENIVLDGPTLKALEASWAYFFKEGVLRNINEEKFKPLYGTKYSRRNAPINVMLGFLIISCYLGMAPKVLYNSILTNLEVRYALDLITRPLSNTKNGLPFSYMSVKRFLARCLQKMQDPDDPRDLIHECFTELFATMARTAGVNTDVLRTDSMMVNSYIKVLNRKELLYMANSVTLRELNRICGEMEGKLPDTLKHYLNTDDRNIVLYHDGAKYEEKVARLIREAGEILAFCESNGHTDFVAYNNLKLVYEQQTIACEDGSRRLRTKEDGGMNSEIIQSIFDTDATFRKKNGKEYRGYVANLVEACGGYGTMIISYALEKNIYSDADFLMDFLEEYGEMNQKQNTADNSSAAAEPSDCQAEVSLDAQEGSVEQVTASLESPVSSSAKNEETSEQDAAAFECPAPSSAKNGETSEQDAAASKCPASSSKKDTVDVNEFWRILSSREQWGDNEERSDEPLSRILERAVQRQAGLKIMAADGAYMSTRNVIACLRHGILLIPTNLTGTPTPKFYANFKFAIDEKNPRVLSCARGEKPCECSYCEANGTYYCKFTHEQCEGCKHFEECHPRKTKDGYLKTITQTTKIRAIYNTFRGTEEFSQICRFRNGIETLPSVLRRRYHCDMMQARSLIRSRVFFGLRVAALNFDKYMRYMKRKARGEARPFSKYKKAEG